jgi:hypothetical protein
MTTGIVQPGNDQRRTATAKFKSAKNGAGCRLLTSMSFAVYLIWRRFVELLMFLQRRSRMVECYTS